MTSGNSCWPNLAFRREAVPNYCFCVNLLWKTLVRWLMFPSACVPTCSRMGEPATVHSWDEKSGCRDQFRIRSKFCSWGFAKMDPGPSLSCSDQPVVIEVRSISAEEKYALFQAADCLLDTSVRDGLNLVRPGISLSMDTWSIIQHETIDVHFFLIRIHSSSFVAGKMIQLLWFSLNSQGAVAH